MKDFLFFSERTKISNKFREWCEENSAEQCGKNFLAWLDENDALNLNKCRAIIDDKKPELVTDPITIEGVKQILDINKDQREALESITEDIDSYINTWGTNGRLIDRNTVIKTLHCIKESATNVLKKEGK